jgi:hypothetical protein
VAREAAERREQTPLATEDGRSDRQRRSVGEIRVRRDLGDEAPGRTHRDPARPRPPQELRKPQRRAALEPERDARGSRAVTSAPAAESRAAGSGLGAPRTAAPV